MLSLLLLTSCYNSENREEILKVYNWADYIDENVLTDFPKWYEEQTGRKVRIIFQTFDINEVMLTKIERGHDVTPKSWTVYLICFDVVSCIVQDSCRA